MAGGYYRHNFPEQSKSLLALNTMYFMSENICQLDKGTKQLDWLDQQLQSGAD